MKTKIDKSLVMRKAWKIFHGNSAWSGDFSESLKRAWEIVKENILYAERKIREAIEMERRENASDTFQSLNGSVVFSAVDAARLTDWYANAPQGTYFGD